MDAFEALSPVSDHYASLPIARAFDWSVVEAALGAGEWYLVAFRSIRRPGADEARLAHYDELAYQEASRVPGYVHYFKGPTASDGTCLSFCIWRDRASARAAAGRPAHVEAVSLLGEMYQMYTLELLRMRRRAGEPFEFEPYDRPELSRPVAVPAPS